MRPWIFVALLAAACGRRAATAPPPVCGPSGRLGPLRFPLGRRGACLVDATGAPVWLHAEAAWSVIVQLDDDELERYLADRKARGTNALLVNLIEHKFADHPPQNRAGVAPFARPGDFSAPNEAYFAHVDQVLRRAGEHGMVVLLAPAYLGYAGKDEGWYDEVRRAGPDVMRAYGKQLGTRYRDVPNILWVEGGDSPPRAAAAEVDALAAGIRETDRVHLHTAHSTRHASALDDYDRPWLDLSSTYSDCDRHAEALVADARRPRTIPTFFIEGTYEDEGAGLSCLIGQAYRALLSGAAGHVFGNKAIWQFSPGWQAALDSPGSRAMQHLAELLATHDLVGLVPDLDGTVVRAKGGVIAAARSTSGDTIAAFVEVGPRLVYVTPPRNSQAWWYDTIHGDARSAGELAAGTEQSLASPPGGPWLLLIKVM